MLVGIKVFCAYTLLARGYDFEVPDLGNAGAGPEPWKRELKFEAVPRCYEKSQWWGDTFWDGSLRKCVHLNRANITVPHSLPCPPGSGRREDEFVCRGRVETAFQIHCKHAWDVVPSKPYYANENYQCVQILVYTPTKQMRCPIDFRLKKLYDRTGYQIQFKKYICVAQAARAAHLVTFDPIIVSNCQYVDEAPYMKPSDLIVDDEDEMEDDDGVDPNDISERRFVKESYHNHDHMRNPDTGRLETYGSGGANNRGRITAKSMGQCTLTKTEQIVMCDYTDKLVWDDEREQWKCVGKVYVTPDPDPTGCRKGFYWSNDFLSCIRVRAYSPERYCGDGVAGPTFAREGSPRRYSRGPRYNDLTAYGDDDFDDIMDEDHRKANETSSTTEKPQKTEAPASKITTTGSSSSESTYAQEPTDSRVGPSTSMTIFESNGRCYTDSALPETPYCPEGYFLEQYHKEQMPICIEAQYSEPMWDCRGIGYEDEVINDNEERICTVAWDGRLEVDGRPPLTKREVKNTWHLARKSVMNLPLYEEAADMKEQFAFGKDVHNAGKISWDSAIRAALQLLNPQETFNPYSAPLTTDGGLVFSGLMGAQQTTT